MVELKENTNARSQLKNYERHEVMIWLILDIYSDESNGISVVLYTYVVKYCFWYIVLGKQRFLNI